MLNTEAEIDLLKASLTGSRDAFGRIVRQYQSLICAITYSTTGDFAKSEELAQETFIRAWKDLAQLKDLAKFRHWLCTIARNLAGTSIKDRRRDPVSTAHPLDQAHTLKAPAPGPDDLAITKEQQTLVWQTLCHIPKKYRAPMVLFYRKEQSVAQIAEALDLSEDAVKQQLSRGRKLLRNELTSLVEDILGKTAPGKAFTLAVVATLPALVPHTAAAAATAATTAKASAAVKTTLAASLSAAVLGPILGLVGAIFGSWMSIKNTKSPRERKFMIKVSIACLAEVLLLLLLIAVTLVLSLKGIITKKVYWTVFAVTMSAQCILLFPAIIWANRRQKRIQVEDGTYVKPQPITSTPTKANIYGSFAGVIFGCLCWLFVMSFIGKDVLVAALIVAFALVLFVVSGRFCLRTPSKYWRIVLADLVLIAAFTFAVVNLRWSGWISIYRQSPNYERINDLSLLLINLILAAVFGVLILALAIISRKQNRSASQQ